MSQAAVDRANARVKLETFRCLQCGARFLTASGLAHHVELTHKRRVPKPEVGSREGKVVAVAALPVASGISGRMLSKVQAQGNACLWCGAPFVLNAGSEHPLSPSREHAVPRSLGGTKILGIVHKRCNSIRGTMDAGAFRRLMNGEAVTRSELWPHLFPHDDTPQG